MIMITPLRNFKMHEVGMGPSRFEAHFRGASCTAGGVELICEGVVLDLEDGDGVVETTEAKDLGVDTPVLELVGGIAEATVVDVGRCEETTEPLREGFGWSCRIRGRGTGIDFCNVGVIAWSIIL